MPRVKNVQKCRKEQMCGHCAASIKVGQAYRWWALKTGPRSSRKFVRCMDLKCAPKPSEMTTSKMGTIYDAQRSIEESINGADDVAEIGVLMSNFAMVVREVADEYRESADAIESGFGHSTEKSDELAQRADDLEAWADDCESFDAEEFDEEDWNESEGVDYKTDDERAVARDEAHDDHLAEKRGEAIELVTADPT